MIAASPARLDPRFREGADGLEPVPPSERCACGQRDWVRSEKRWFCRWCWRLATTAAPSAAELAAARTAAETGRITPAVAAASAQRAAVEAVRVRASSGIHDARALGRLRAEWQATLLHRLAPQRYPRSATTQRWLDVPVLELVREYVACHAVDPGTLGPAELVRLALEGGPHEFVRVGYHSTADFPGLLDTVAQTLFLDAYADTVRSFAPWTTAVTVADFRSTVATWTEFPTLFEVPEHGEYVAGSPFGPAAPIRLVTFGRTLGLTRQALLRDDLATAGQLLQALGVAAAHVENDATYELLTSNPTMADGTALFSAAHGNLLPAAALDATSLAAACAALATNSAHGRPAFLLVGTADGAIARPLVAVPNPSATSGSLEVIQDDRIRGGWYVTCDPRERPTLVTAHRRAVDAPELLSRDSWDVDARSYKGRDDFGVAAVDWRSMVFTPAA
jgi:hypothetical protein